MDPGGGLGIRKIGSVPYFKAVFTAHHRSGQQLLVSMYSVSIEMGLFKHTYKLPSNLTGLQIKDQLPIVAKALLLFSSSIKLAVYAAKHILSGLSFIY